MNCIFPITKTPFHSGQMVFRTLGENIADFQFGFVLLVSDVFVLPITLCVVLSSLIPSRCHTRLLYVNLFFLTSVLFDHTDIANFSVIAHYPVVPGHFHCHI